MQRAVQTSARAFARTVARPGCIHARIPAPVRPTPPRHCTITPHRTFSASSLARNSSASTRSPLAATGEEVETHALPAPSASSPAPSGVLKVDPRKRISFNCGVDGCGVRQTHEFTKRSYESGIVIVQCPGCKTRHLIADHMGWFKEVTGDGQQRTIEDIMKAKGVTIKRGHVDSDGEVTEYAPE